MMSGQKKRNALGSKEMVKPQPAHPETVTSEPGAGSAGVLSKTGGKDPIGSLVTEMTGIHDRKAAILVAGQLVDAVASSGGSDETKNGALALLKGIKPQGEIESMLASQMVTAHTLAMECARRAMAKSQFPESVEANLNQANKLMRTFAVQLEALNRHRGKGQQRMTVEHVHVHSGGQAVVGLVNQGGGGEKEDCRQ